LSLSCFLSYLALFLVQLGPRFSSVGAVLSFAFPRQFTKSGAKVLLFFDIRKEKEKKVVFCARKVVFFGKRGMQDICKLVSVLCKGLSKKLRQFLSVASEEIKKKNGRLATTVLRDFF